MFRKFLKRPFILCSVLGILMNIILDLCSRDDPLSFFEHITGQPGAFLFNCVIVTLTFMVSLFFKRKYFVISLVSLVWVGFAIANVVAIIQKSTPISPGDILVIQLSWDFVSKYISVFGIICMILAVLSFGFLMSFLYRAGPQTNRRVFSASIVFSVLTFVAYILVADVFGLGIDRERLNHYKYACEEYGYVYTFLRSATERGMEEPDPQDILELENLIDEMDGMESTPAGAKPNIIMLQLESFFDVNQLNGVKFSEEPIPFYVELKKNFSHGGLRVPSIGAGTANTEFEILTQMNIDFFGSGEYPYSTVLKDKAVESVAFDMKAQGYDTFAIHSNNATFYDRDIVFSYMGFDCFISKEYMTEYDLTPSGWIKDDALIPEILACLDSTEGKDFIYTISVQGHGAYSKEKDPSAKIKVSAPGRDEEFEARTQYYVNQIHETDQFLGQLLNILDKREEPTMVVLFGDHMPPLDLENSELMFGDIFETEYLIWTNYDSPRVIRDLEAYQLSSHAMNLAGTVEGLMTELHVNYSDHEDYQSYLESAQYDMIYSDSETVGEESRYHASDLKLGLQAPEKKISIHSVSFQDELLYIRGQNFTESGVLFINGRSRDAERISPQLLCCEYVPEPGDELAVVQVSDDGKELSSTEIYIWK